LGIGVVRGCDWDVWGILHDRADEHFVSVQQDIVGGALPAVLEHFEQVGPLIDSGSDLLEVGGPVEVMPQLESQVTRGVHSREWRVVKGDAVVEGEVLARGLVGEADEG